MNEKIKELMVEADLAWIRLDDPEIPNKFVVSGPFELGERLAAYEKFAELIVQECIKQVEPTQHHEVWAQSYLGGVDGLDLLSSKIKDIKKHFGVE